MQIDFHYCCIKALAQAAGFSPKEAQTIAYASQYTDDAVEHLPLRIEGLPNDIKKKMRTSKDEFNPTCTAHKALTLLTAAAKKNSQRKVYIPFHFLPSEPYESPGDYDYRVVQNSKLSRMLIETAAIELEKATRQRFQKLIKLGIALHSYADTFAHRKFSGRLSKKDNDVTRIRPKNIHTLLARIIAGIPVLEIGHSQAAHLPDYSFQRWQYNHVASGRTVRRNNTNIFVFSARKIHRILLGISPEKQKAKDFDEIKDQLRACFEFGSMNKKKRIKKWREIFPDTTFNYDQNTWRKKAFTGVRYDFVNFLPTDYKLTHYRYNGDRRFFYFHEEAARQRKFVLDRIRKDLA